MNAASLGTVLAGQENRRDAFGRSLSTPCGRKEGRVGSDDIRQVDGFWTSVKPAVADLISETSQTAFSSGKKNAKAAEAREAGQSKDMHGHPDQSADEKKIKRGYRISVPLTPGRSRQLDRIAHATRRDKSALIEDAVEAVYGRGAEFVRLRSSARGLASFLFSVALIANRVAELVAQCRRNEANGFAEAATRVVVLAQLDAIHEGLVDVMRLVAEWRARDEAFAESLVGASGVSAVQCEEGGEV